MGSGGHLANWCLGKLKAVIVGQSLMAIAPAGHHQSSERALRLDQPRLGQDF
jgi:hypothetical protein